MKTNSIICALIALFAFIPSLYAGKIITETINSNVLGAPRSYNVYLPDGFNPESNRTYPVLYLLHGFSDDHTAWTNKGQLQTVIDELIGTGEAVPMVIIMPEAGGPDTEHTWNGYFDMEGWPYETFFFKEFLPMVEKKFHIQGDKAHRAISGLSMGGGGSVSYCQRHPEMFSACYELSGWLHADVDESKRSQKSSSKSQMVTFAVHDQSCLDFLKNITPERVKALRSVKWFADCGDDDFLLDVNIDFYRLMRSNKIPCEFRIRNGVHNWEYWHTGLRQSLPFVSRNFAK